MICKANYNEVKDISPVDQFGYVDLGEAFVNGVVPLLRVLSKTSSISLMTLEVFFGSPKNVFDAIEMGSAVSSYSPPASGVNDGESIDKGE